MIYVMRYRPKRDPGTYVAVSSEFIRLLMHSLSSSSIRTILAIAELQTRENPHYTKATAKRIRKLAGISQHPFEKAVQELRKVGMLEVTEEGHFKLNVIETDNLKSLHPDYTRCWKCGDDETDLLDPHFFDGNPRNVDAENICFLCPKCIARSMKSGVNVTSVGDDWAIKQFFSKPKVLSRVAESAIDVAESATQSSRKCYTYKEDKNEEGGKEGTPPLSRDNVVKLYGPEDRADDAAILRQLYEDQLTEAKRIGNPVLKTTAYRKGKLPPSYTPYKCPEELEELGCKTMFLYATNILLTVQKKVGVKNVVTPSTTKEVEVMGDLLASFLTGQGWSGRWARFTEWACYHKENMSILLLPYYYPDWAAAQSPAARY